MLRTPGRIAELAVAAGSLARRLACAGFLAAGVSASNAPTVAAADGHVVLEQDTLADEEWRALRTGLEASVPAGMFDYAVERFVAEGRANDRAGVWEWLRRVVIKAARVDLTGDGHAELVLGYFADPFCAPFECSGEVWQQVGGAWKAMVHFPIVLPHHACLRVLAPDELPYLVTPMEAVHWNGSEYERPFRQHGIIRFNAGDEGKWPLLDRLAATDFDTCQAKVR